MRVNDRYISIYYRDDEDIRPICLTAQKLALLLVDFQEVFIRRPAEYHEEGGLPTNDEWSEYYDAIEMQVVPNTRRLLEVFRGNGLEVVFAKVQALTKNGRERSLDHRSTGFNDLLLTHDSLEGRIIPEVSPIEDEIVVSKTTDSALTGTNLRLLLRNLGMEEVAVCGVYTDQCISSTVRSLADESFKVWLIEDACMAAAREIHEHELTVLNNIYCHVVSTEEFLAAVETACKSLPGRPE